MNDCRSIISGEIYSSLCTNELSTLLTKHDISSSLGDSSQYHNNTYIRIEEGATNFILENCQGEYTAMGESSSCDRMYKAAKRVSDVLTLLDISHAFEIYTDSDPSKMLELVYYLHHNCPLETSDS
jgi:hypothetical protein